MTIQIGNSVLLDVWAAAGLTAVPSGSKLDSGWLGGEQPPAEYMNFIQKAFGQKINHLLSNGTAEYDSTRAYTLGSLVKDNNVVFQCISAAAIGESPSGTPAKWSQVVTLNTAETNLSKALDGRIVGGQVSMGTDTQHDIVIQAGRAKALNSSKVIEWPTVTREIDAPLDSGDGGLASGTVAAFTTYHIFAVLNPATGDVKVLFSNSLTAADAPSGYTDYIRLHSLKTNSGANIRPFRQVGQGANSKILYQSTSDIFVGKFSTTTSAALITTPLPIGLPFEALLAPSIEDILANTYIMQGVFTSPSMPDIPANGNVHYIDGRRDSAAPYFTGDSILIDVETDDSARIRARFREAQTLALNMNCLGYRDILLGYQ